MAQMHVPVMRLPSRYYRQIGEFIFRYAQLEYQLHEIVWALLRLEYKAGRILTVGSESRVLRAQIATILKSVKWVKDPGLITEIKAISGVAADYYERRNYLAHGTWQAPWRATSKTSPRLHRMVSAEERLMPAVFKGVDASEIRKWVLKLKSANVRARTLIRRFNRELPSSQPRYA
jgi:hypothetical protein